MGLELGSHPASPLSEWEAWHVAVTGHRPHEDLRWGPNLWGQGFPTNRHTRTVERMVAVASDLGPLERTQGLERGCERAQQDPDLERKRCY